MKATVGGISLAIVAIVGLALSLTGAGSEAAPPASAVEQAATSSPPAAAATPAPSPSISPFLASSGIAVQLGFASPGVLTQVLVKVGDRVIKGQALATVDASAAQIAVTSAQANLDKARQALATLTQGLTPQEQAQLNQGDTQAAAAVTNAQQALADAQAQAEQDAETQTSLISAAEQSLSDAEAQANQDATDDAQQVAAAQAQLAADEAQMPPDQVKIAADTAAVTAAQDNLASTALKDAQQVHMATADVTNTQNAEAATALHDAQAIHQAQANFSAQQQQLATTKAADAVRTEPPRTTALDNARDDVTAAQAQLQSAQLALSATTLRAPAGGVISAINGDVGELLSGNGGSTFMTLEEPGSG
jgi:HlyD family secretion protein